MTVDVPGHVGAYRIAGRIGRGAMGVVYRAIDTRNGREVALKVMLPDFASDENARSRFLREADAIGRLQHRNIVTVYECGVVDDAPFIAMELLQGSSLAARLAGPDPIPLEASLNVVIQLCDGLQFAHDNGVVHRDVKPANVWLLDNGGVKLLDFGIAKLSGLTLTHGGGVVGSAAYMSPEQFGGGEVDGRADIFSAGAVLYELLARRRAFDGESVTAVMHRILHEAPPPLATHAPQLPHDVAHAVDTALQKSPHLRYANAADFGDELRLAQYTTTSAADATVIARRDRPAPELAPPAPHVPAGLQIRPQPVNPATPPIVSAPPPAQPHVAAGLETRPSEAPVAPPAAPPPATVAAPGPVRRSPLPPARPEWLAFVEGHAQWVGWVAVAAGTMAVASLVVALIMRPRTPVAPPPSFEIRVQSTPQGAAIAFDGRPTGRTTPATVAWEHWPARVNLTIRGFQPVDASVPAQSGEPLTLSYTLRQLLRIVSEPPGAQIFLDGRSAGVTTPAEIAVPDPPPAAVEVRLAAVRRTIALTKQALESGELRFALAATAKATPGDPPPPVNRTPVSVRVTGNYPFEVAGCDVMSASANDHDLQVMAPCTLRLRASTYLLDTARAIEASSGRVEIGAPQLARVQLRSRYEWCTVILNGHAVGAPPVDLDLAAGSYTATIQCPDKRYTTRAFTIDPGRSIRRLDDELLP